MVKNNWTGESFSLDRNNEDYSVCHTVFGSGVAVISKKIYPAEIMSSKRMRFFY